MGPYVQVVMWQQAGGADWWLSAGQHVVSHFAKLLHKGQYRASWSHRDVRMT
jgi:hypothetical protein